MLEELDDDVELDLVSLLEAGAVEELDLSALLEVTGAEELDFTALLELTGADEVAEELTTLELDLTLDEAADFEELDTGADIELEALDLIGALELALEDDAVTGAVLLALLEDFLTELLWSLDETLLELALPVGLLLWCFLLDLRPDDETPLDEAPDLVEIVAVELVGTV